MKTTMTELYLVLTFAVLIIAVVKLYRVSKKRDELFNLVSRCRSDVIEVDRWMASFPQVAIVTEYLLKKMGHIQGHIPDISAVREEVRRASKVQPAAPELTAGLVNQAHNLYAEGLDYDLFMVTVLNGYLAGKAVTVEHISAQPTTPQGEAAGMVLLSKLVVGDVTVFERGEDSGTAE